ncbi:MAG: polyphosphate kinase 1 [Pyrinomonadaceae bacterium]
MASSIRNLLSTDRFNETKMSSVSAGGQNAIFINRDLSLLEFFRRVLDEGLDKSQDLLERLKFLAIFSSNIDEFFMIRVSALKEKLGQRFDVSPDGYTLPDLLLEIRDTVEQMVALHAESLASDILPALASHGVNVKKYSELDESERSACDKYFAERIYPVLTAQAVDPTHPFPYISGGSMNLGLFIKPKLGRRVARVLKNAENEFFVRLKIPPFIPRFIPLGDGFESFVPAEDLIAANLNSLIPGISRDSCFAFRITRDADIDLRESEAEDLLETMEDNLKQRRFGDVVRLEVSSKMPAGMIQYLISSLTIERDDVYRIDGLMNSADLWELVGLDRPDLKAPPIIVRKPAEFETGESVFEIIKRKDRLLHHPYMPYSIIIDMIREAAEDPDVLAIKMCLYRIGPDSPLAPLLIEASERGKQVTVVIEIKARFDEANNMEWGRKLERAGVHVVYGLLGLKTHAKTTLIVRREGDDLRRYVHLSTGNYNPATSTVYTDLGLLTADREIGEDVSEIFNYLTVYTEPKEHRKLLVAPLNLRERMVALIEREAENARDGRPAGIIAKINRLADSRIVNALYEASRAGVEIDLIVRGICTLRPGVPGLSENIRVRSVVGRLLEHSRVYCFMNGGDREVFIGSSDWMPRNLDRRVEVLAPIEDENIRQFLIGEYLASYLQDNVKARKLMPDGSYTRFGPSDGVEPFESQVEFQRRKKPLDFSAKESLKQGREERNETGK